MNPAIVRIHPPSLAELMAMDLRELSADHLEIRISSAEATWNEATPQAIGSIISVRTGYDLACGVVGCWLKRDVAVVHNRWRAPTQPFPGIQSWAWYFLWDGRAFEQCSFHSEPVQEYFAAWEAMKGLR